MEANKKRYYSPPFSDLAVVSVRRLAWAMGKTMPAAIDFMVRLLPSSVDPSKVCLSCKDTSACKTCIFCRQLNTQDKASLLAAF
jgi:recombinational DNA repair protein RecR